ncbi:hypothetical protein FB381_4649 [Nocardioides albertanoniae]|uniref:Uncharacterized protein n=1 Tax=Nocardioides albertanoniae TaxID=1175486 RepID=A0A543ADP9_9ACTN|nr:MFS transporter [Nocardioides albertanoniae]TQL70709.1 hypothetical protein FB381_4649 [Nocardioides albertanoniae]
MSNDPADKLAAPSFGFKKKRGGAKPAKAKSEATPSTTQPETAAPAADAAESAPAESTSATAQGEKTQVLEKAAPSTADPVDPDPVVEDAPKKQKAEKAQKAKSAKQPKLAKPKPAKKPRPAKEPKASSTPKAPKQPKDPSQRRLNIGMPSGLSAAVMIGAIVGAFMALAVWFSGTVSQWTRGTSSLGDSGAFVLIAVFALAIVVGGYLLRLASARSPFTISFLGSALVAVLSMLFLTELFNYAWGVIVVVFLTAAAYALAHWVTTNYID